MSVRRVAKQRCTANDRKGQRCGRMAPPGAMFCHLHDPKRGPGGVVAMQETDDLRELLRRLTRDRDATVKLRAIEALLKWDERRGCASCAERATELPANWLDRATKQQVDELRALVVHVKHLKAVILAQPVQPQSVPEQTNHRVERTEIETTVGPGDSAAHESTATECEYVDAGTSEVPIALYEELGLSRLDDGSATHALGDEHAARIVAGEIDIDAARAAQRTAMRSLHQMEASNRLE